MCPLVRFWRTFLLQRLLKNFLEVWVACSRYLMGATRSSLSNALTFVTIQLRNPFLRQEKQQKGDFWESQAKTRVETPDFQVNLSNF